MPRRGSWRVVVVVQGGWGFRSAVPGAGRGYFRGGAGRGAGPAGDTAPRWPTVLCPEDVARLPQRFFARPVSEVARALLGTVVRHGEVAVRITETEAYGGPEDTASHARFGDAGRSAPMFGPPGRAYVYLCYGIHDMFNIVCGPRGEASAVLVRSGEPVAGLELIRARRGGKSGPALLNGPGKVGQALAVEPSFSHHPLYRAGGVTVHGGLASGRVTTGPRVGIDYAAPGDRRRPWRFYIADSAWVSRPG